MDKMDKKNEDGKEAILVKYISLVADATFDVDGEQAFPETDPCPIQSRSDVMEGCECTNRFYFNNDEETGQRTCEGKA